MHPDAITHLTRLREYLRANRERLVIDADAHVTDPSSLAEMSRHRHETGPDYYHGRPISATELLWEMGHAAVDMALIWQNPATTIYADDAGANRRALLASNRHIRDVARDFPDRFIPAGWTDPKALGLEGALQLVDTLVLEFGFPFVKQNPAQNRFPIDSEESMRVVDRIVELGATPAFHFGADTPFTPAAGLAAVARRHPGHPLLAVHMGGGGAGYIEAEPLYHEARALGLEHPNIWYALSTRRDAHTESDFIAYQLAGEPFCRRLCCASDAPYGRVTWNFGGFRAMLASLRDAEHHPDPRVRAAPGLFGDAACRGFLGGNLADLALGGCERLLDQHRTT